MKKMHVVLRKALSQAVSDGLIQRNAADSVKPPRASASGEEIRPLNFEECSAFLEASRGERLEALYVLAVHCGLREGELLALRWNDVDFEATKPALLVRCTLTRGEDGRGYVVGARSSPAKDGAYGSPSEWLRLSRITASANSKRRYAWPGFGRAMALYEGVAFSVWSERATKLSARRTTKEHSRPASTRTIQYRL